MEFIKIFNRNNNNKIIKNIQLLIIKKKNLFKLSQLTSKS